MSPVVWAVIAAMGILALVQFANNKKRSQAMISTAGEVVRLRTQYEIETDEDLEVIQEVYREDRKRERARMALERLGRTTPEAAAPSAPSKSAK